MCKKGPKEKNWGPTFLGLNLAKMGLNFEAPAHPFHPGAPNGDIQVYFKTNIYNYVCIYIYVNI